jgi:2'-5' RNA ligase
VSGERRLFLAVALDDDSRHALAAFVSGDEVPEIPGRRVPPENWHITLRFLGRSSRLQQEKVLADLDQSLDHDPFLIGFGGLGTFPYPAKATVVWLAVAAGGDDLVDLAVSCERSAVAAGYDPEERPFHPHLSLSRVRPPQNLAALVDEFPPFPGRLHVDAVVLYESITGSGATVYRELDRVGL